MTATVRAAARRFVAVLALVGVVLVGAASSAFAHVSVDGGGVRAAVPAIILR